VNNFDIHIIKENNQKIPMKPLRGLCTAQLTNNTSPALRFGTNDYWFIVFFDMKQFGNCSLSINHPHLN
jgi:hypothetical protein